MTTDIASYNFSTSLELSPFLVLLQTHFSCGVKKVIGFFTHMHEKVKQQCPGAIEHLWLPSSRKFLLSSDIQSFSVVFV